MSKIRRNVLNLPSGDKTLFWYGRAIGEMQKRPIANPTSWRFQAAIHDYVRSFDPLKISGETLPSTSFQSKFWRQCQHGSWFFLPWHRMYLHFFEQIVAAEVAKLHGPPDWALPYWNYSGSDINSRLLPEPFRSPTLSDGTTNFLFVQKRNPRCNQGLQFADDRDVDVEDALDERFFSNGNLGNFGGPPTLFSHNGPFNGVLENTPHGNIHGAVAGAGGWMGGFNTAALDPIFWLHHANLDRLWEVWLRRDSGNRNPTSLQWLNNVTFSFQNAAGQVVTMRCADVVDTNALGYSYDDVSDPIPASGAPIEPESATFALEVTMPNSVPPELVGATESSFEVGNAPVHIQVSTPQQTDARARFSESISNILEAVPENVDLKPRVLLQLENLTAEGRTNSYDVYVNVPEGGNPVNYPERFAGRLSLFGVAEASRSTDLHAGSGLTYRLDITDIYNLLSTQEDWSPENIRVSFVPVREWKGSTVTVGRVSLFLG